MKTIHEVHAGEDFDIDLIVELLEAMKGAGMSKVAFDWNKDGNILIKG